MKAPKLILCAVLGLSALSLNSCLIQQAVNLVVRNPYPGERPPMVIADNNGKPAGGKWLSVSSDVLPAPNGIEEKVKNAPDGIPYGLSTEYSDIVISPYAPHYNLDHRGIKAGSKVWDPYTHKPFYIPRTYTIN